MLGIFFLPFCDFLSFLWLFLFLWLQPPLTGGNNATSAPAGTPVLSSANSLLTAMAERSRSASRAGYVVARTRRRSATVAPADSSTKTSPALARSRARANSFTRHLIRAPTRESARASAAPAPATDHTIGQGTVLGGVSACRCRPPSVSDTCCTRSSRTTHPAAPALGASDGPPPATRDSSPPSDRRSPPSRSS